MAPPNSLSVDPKTKRWLMIASIGAFVIFAGYLAPRLVPLQSLVPQAPAPTPAAETKTPAEPASPEPDVNAPIGRLVVGATVLIVLCAGLVWYTRRRAAAQGATAPGLLRVAAALPLPYRCCVFLVEVGDRRLLTAVDAAGIQAVVPLPDPELAETAPTGG